MNPDILVDMESAPHTPITESGQPVNTSIQPDILPDISAIDANVENVRRKLAARAEMGLKKYGVTTERTDLTTLDWLNHAQQEAMDMCVYLERLIQDEQRQLQDIDQIGDLSPQEFGNRLETLGYALQNPKSRLKDLVKLGMQCGILMKLGLESSQDATP